MSDTTWRPAPVAVVAAAATAAVGEASHTLAGVPWVAPPIAAGSLAAVALIGILVDGISSRRSLLVAVALLAAGGWAAAVARIGLSPLLIGALLIGATIAAAVWHLIPTPDDAVPVVAADRRPRHAREWEQQLHGIVGKGLTVTAARPWPVPEDGERIHIDLHSTGELTIDTLQKPEIKRRISAARRLPHGCTVEVLDGAHQAEVILDVMLRNTLADAEIADEPTAPTSITEPMVLMRSTRRELLEARLRIETLVIGGATGSGKTTLLDRILMRIERCYDALAWVLDMNGGGLAESHIRPWALGQCGQPGVDWVAGDTYEGIAMMACANAIIQDRKTDPECLQRMDDDPDGSSVLPIDKDKPELLIIADEGAELKKRGKHAYLVDEGVTELARTGRAMGGRLIMSVLRGTSDALTKGIRAQSGLRVCLRLNEQDEYAHFFDGRAPGRIRLTEPGQGWMIRPSDPRPLLGRTANVHRAAKARHVIATAHIRPALDARGREVAASLRLADIFPESLLTPEFRRTQLARDIEAGRVYEGRWDRAAAMLARLRGERVRPEARQTVQAGPETAAPTGSATERLLLMGRSLTRQPSATTAAPVALDDDAVMAEFAALTASQHLLLAGSCPDRVVVERPEGVTTRARIMAMLDKAYPGGMTTEQLDAQLAGADAAVSKQRRHQLMSALEDKGLARREGQLWYAVR